MLLHSPSGCEGREPFAPLADRTILVIWTKTEAGRHEIQARALVKERARRNLLLLIDGVKSEEMLLGSLAGIGAEDFKALAALKLIEPLSGRARATDSGPVSRSAPLPTAPAAPAPAARGPAAAFDYATFTSTLTQLISSQLGLRGFALTLAVEKASTNEELQAVAQRTLDAIRDRKGEAAATAARQALYGG
jgi:hypothetical protein